MAVRLRKPDDLDDQTADKLEPFVLRRGQPLPLFEALAHSPAALDDLIEGSRRAMDETKLDARLREILILRTLAAWSARGEWDVHASIYAPVAPLTVAEVAALGFGTGRIRWTTAERLLIDLADALRAAGTVGENLWRALAHAFDEEQLAEIVLIAAQYVKVAMMNNVLAVPRLVPEGPPIARREGR